MKRKPPKNLRPYATPSGKKAKLTEVSGTEGRYLLEHQGDIGVPHLYQIASAQGLPFFYAANATELRKWRERGKTFITDSENTSGENMTIEFHVEPAEALRLILDTVEELTRMKLDKVEHLAIENFAPELFRNMMQAYYADAGVTVTNVELTPQFQANGEPWNHEPGAINVVNL